MTLVDEAREHLMKLDGTLVPEFVQVIDGWYRERIVMDDEVECVEIRAWDRPEPVAIVCHTEPCHIPRYRTEVRWVPAEWNL